MYLKSIIFRTKDIAELIRKVNNNLKTTYIFLQHFSLAYHSYSRKNVPKRIINLEEIRSYFIHLKK